MASVVIYEVLDASSRRAPAVTVRFSVASGSQGAADTIKSLFTVLSSDDTQRGAFLMRLKNAGLTATTAITVNTVEVLTASAPAPVAGPLTAPAPSPSSDSNMWAWLAPLIILSFVCMLVGGYVAYVRYAEMQAKTS